MSRTACAGCRVLCFLFLLALAAAAFTPAALAEPVEQKWRVGLALGGYNPVHDISSPAANVLALRDEALELSSVFVDPRDDSTTFGNLDLQSGSLAKLSAQYGLSKIFVLEGSVGYGKTDLGDVALDVQFLSSGPPIQELDFNFSNFRVPVGEVERIPIQLSGLARFRPRANFNPYFGAGIGYVVQGFEPSDEINTLSRNMDRASGTQMKVGDAFNGNPQINPAGDGEARDLSGATVDVRDSFEWHLVAGADLSFSPRWSTFADIRWTDASREISVGFNGSSELGVSIPQFEDYTISPIGIQFIGGDGGGPVLITEGGLIDGGEIVYVHKEGFNDSDTQCTIPGDPFQDNFCELVWIPASAYETDPRLSADFEPNNELDPGHYYVHGGTVSIDGFSFLVGVRYTF